MSFSTTISRTELARSTRKKLERARRGQTLFVKSYGEEQITIMDALDYRLLRAVASYRGGADAPIADHEQTPQGLSEMQVQEVAKTDDLQAVWNLVISAYLDGDISLGRATLLLDMNRFELSARFNRLSLPLRLGAVDSEDVLVERKALANE